MSLNPSSTNNSNSNLNFHQQITNANPNVILQTLRRRNVKQAIPLDERVTLEKAFGFSINSNAKISRSTDSLVAYIAGCVIVIYDIKSGIQDFIISQARKTLTTLSFSHDNKLIVTGESGHEPKVRLWDVKEKIQIAEFGGHKFSIECVCFSPSSNMIISVGSIHDMVVNVWNWKTKFKVASNKISCKVRGIAFAKDGSYFVTVGNRHVKFWYLTVSTLMETVPLKGRAAILDYMKNNYFCDVVCGRTSELSHFTFIITTNGYLCQFDENRALKRCINLNDKAHCLCADDNHLYIGCSNSTILVFDQKTLEYVATIPRSHNLGVNISKHMDTSHLKSYLEENLLNKNLKYPDCIGLSYIIDESYLCAIYNDHSFYIWDVKDYNAVKKIDSHLYHSSCCWSLDILSNLVSNPMHNTLPHDTFITCSTDNTIRLWSLDTNFKNIYSKELINIIYIDNDLSTLCNSESLININQEENLNAGNSFATGISCNINGNSVEQQQINKLGAKCLKINPFGTHLATGDRNGNIRIYDLKNLESVVLIEAHESEILNLQYSQPESGYVYLASSGRDRLIHIFDSRRNYELVQTIDDQSAAITATRFSYNQHDKQFYLISCGYDKSIIIRMANEVSGDNNNNTRVQFQRTSYIVEKQTFYDLSVDPRRSYVNTISQDRVIRTYSIKDGKKQRQFKGSLNEDGYLIKMDMDHTGTLLATSCTDKCVYIWDLISNECVAYLYGHSELISDLKFTHDGKHLITVSVDGCIFVWKLSVPLNTSTAAAGITPVNQIKKASQNSRPITPSITDSDTFKPIVSTRFSGKSTSDCLQQNIMTNATATSSATSVDSSQTQAPVRRSGRAVWGPVCNTSFAIMIDNELDDVNSSMASETHTPPIDKVIINNKITTTSNLSSSNSVSSVLSELSLPVVQFPSPIVERSMYHVITLDSANQNDNPNGLGSTRNSLQDENLREDENPDNYMTPVKCQQGHSNNSPMTANTRTDDFMHQKSQYDSIQRRQSLSARYLMQTSCTNQQNEAITPLTVGKIDEESTQSSPSPPTSPTVQQAHESPSRSANTSTSIPESLSSSSNFLLNQNQFASDFFKIRKNKSINHLQANSLHFQHTESSLNKIRAKQQDALESLGSVESSGEPVVHKPIDSVKSSPIKTNFLENAESTLNNLKRTASLLGLNNIDKPQNNNINGHKSHLLPSSMSSNNMANVRIGSELHNGSATTTTSNCLPPKSLPIKQSRPSTSNSKQPQQHQQPVLNASKTSRTNLTKSANESSVVVVGPVVTTPLRKLSTSIQNLQLTKSPSNDLKTLATSRRIHSTSAKKPIKYRRSNTEEVINLSTDLKFASERKSQSPPLVTALDYADFDYDTYVLKYNRAIKLLEQLNKIINTDYILDNLTQMQKDEIYNLLYEHNVNTTNFLDYLKNINKESLTVNAT